MFSSYAYINVVEKQNCKMAIKAFVALATLDDARIKTSKLATRLFQIMVSYILQNYKS